MGYDKEAFASRLRGKRAEKRMSQRDLAEKSGVSIAALNQYENEGYAPGVDKLCMLAEALGCSPDELLGWE